MRVIKTFFSESDEAVKVETGDVEYLMDHLDGLEFTTEITDEEKSVVSYYAGYIAKSLLRAKNSLKSNFGNKRDD